MNAPRHGMRQTPRRLAIVNRQRDCLINGHRLRNIVLHHLNRQLDVACYDLTVLLVTPARMAEVNEHHLGHTGPTDVITFDYTEPGLDRVAGELLVCPAVAREQARDYRTTWDAEVLRYIVHGILHLQGYDDQTGPDRRRMKREEDRRVQALLTDHPPHLIRSPSVKTRG